MVVASPTYAGKLPNKILPDFQGKLYGNGALAVAVVTFGNRSYDNSLAELCAVLEGDGFHTVAGAAFACRHAFTDALADGRPDWDDKRAMEAFAGQIAEKIKESTDIPAPITVPGDAAAPYYVRYRRSAGQVPEGQAPDGSGQVHQLRCLCPVLPHGCY